MRYVFWLLLIALLIWGWQNPERVRSTSDTVMKWTGEKSRWVADKWAPLPPPPPPPAPVVVEPPLPDLPEGVFLLRQEVIVSTGQGTVKWIEGTAVRKIGEGAGKVLVSDGINQTTLDDSMLTRDPQERKALYKKMEVAKGAEAKKATAALETELAAVEAKISSLQSEKRQLAMRRAQQPTLGDPGDEFLDRAIQREEDHRKDLYKQLGRSAPKMVLAR